MDMARLARRWRVVKWMGLVAFLVLFAAWLSGPCRYVVSYLKVDSSKPGTWNLHPDPQQPAATYSLPQHYVYIAGGALQWSWAFQRPVGLDPGWKAYRLPEHMSATTPWLPRFVTNATASHATLPLWPALLTALAVTAYLFGRDRRIPPHHCQNCRYNLTGNTSGTCPECGAII
jgi:hypothetical protein